MIYGIDIDGTICTTDCDHSNARPYKEIIKKIAYFADSGGSFRYGSPLKSKAFQESKNIQLCIHPVWWMNSKKTVQKTIEEVLKNKSDNFIKHIKSTIKTFN